MSAGINISNQVLNQFGSPSINSNTLANRPAFGQIGRLFVDTTNNVLFRDTGTSWDEIGGGIGSQNLQQVTTIGNTTNQGIFSGNNIAYVPGFAFAFAGLGYNQFVSNYNNNASAQVGSYLQNNYSILSGGSVTSLGNFINTAFTELVFKTQGTIVIPINLNISSSFALMTFNGVGGGTINVDQSGIRTFGPLMAKTNFTITTAPVTLSHYASLTLYPPEGIGVTQNLNITNYYGCYMPSSGLFSKNANFTNKWGFYQNGNNDPNYFAGVMLLGTNVPTGRRLVVNGLIEVQTTTDSAVHTPSAKHLPIVIKEGLVTTTYYLQLLN
jgi:hypothetical protein